jgi:proteasome lid subunit RPN8/RPN11
MNEVCYVLVGQHRGRIWFGRLRKRQVGEPGSVEFDWAWVLEREERRGDILGSFHTHPSELGLPSQRDVRTMQDGVPAWQAGTPCGSLFSGMHERGCGMST